MRTLPLDELVDLTIRVAILTVIFMISWTITRQEKTRTKWIGSVVLMLVGCGFVVFSAFFVHLRGFSSVIDALTFEDLSRYSFSIAIGYSMIVSSFIEITRKTMPGRRQRNNQEEE